MKFSAAQIDRIEEQIDLLIATNDRSPVSDADVLVYLQQLISDGTSRENAVACELSESVQPRNVDSVRVGDGYECARLTIYNTQGVVIRTLEFGHQSAGYYVGRDRAAYWDGRNALGEQVASGLYFYQLETDEMSSMRKMVILK